MGAVYHRLGTLQRAAKQKHSMHWYYRAQEDSKSKIGEKHAAPEVPLVGERVIGSLVDKNKP